MHGGRFWLMELAFQEAVRALSVDASHPASEDRPWPARWPATMGSIASFFTFRSLPLTHGIDRQGGQRDGARPTLPCIFPDICCNHDFQPMAFDDF